MKKIISVKEILIVLIAITIISIATSVFAVNPVLGDNNTLPPIDPSDYNNAQTPSIINNTSNLPQTGIEDYNIGILLVICIASAIFAYKKISDYKNV